MAKELKHISEIVFAAAATAIFNGLPQWVEWSVDNSVAVEIQILEPASGVVDIIEDTCGAKVAPGKLSICLSGSFLPIEKSQCYLAVAKKLVSVPAQGLCCLVGR